ncbi:MAG: hypothetical protein FGM54_09960 [Chitinophagaceae bacterium]|nr:hypothetical protein [Chitinophagaceae bacterium]
MKKITLIAGLLLAGFGGFAQKAKIQDALNAIKENDLKSAKKAIDEATTNESTIGNAKAWLVKGVVYQAISTPADIMPQLIFMLGDNAYNVDVSGGAALRATAPDAESVALEAYKKTVALDPKYDKNALTVLLTTMGMVGYNNAVSLMNASKFNDAYTSFGNVAGLAEIDGGKLWKTFPQADTIFASAKLYQGNCAYQMGRDNDAATILESCVKNPITQNADAFVMLTDIYEKTGDDAKWNEAMKAAKLKFPKDKRILNNEINYFIKKGRAEESIAKLKEGIAADPSRTDLQIILGQTYYTMANPEKGARPANAKDLEAQAEGCYKKTIELDAKNSFANYYMGQLYYNRAKSMTDEMNKADDKTYIKMKPERDKLINTALPYLEKAKTLVDTEGVNDGNRDVYTSSLMGLEQAYRIIGNEEKSAEYQKLLKNKK